MARQFSDEEIREIGKHYGKLGCLPPKAFLQQVNCLQSAVLRESLNKGAAASKRESVIPRATKEPVISKERVAELIQSVEEQRSCPRAQPPLAGCERGLADE